jgi:hypothetical protein
MSIVHASWIESFARRLMQLRPAKMPLDAVRDATSVFAESSCLPPEEAAEVFIGRHDKPADPPAGRRTPRQPRDTA